jgi:hypothetical protein
MHLDDEDEDDDGEASGPPSPTALGYALAHALACNAAERDMDYEEYTFEIEDGEEDGAEIKVLVIRV